MGLFKNLKKIFTKEEDKKEEVKIYEEGLTKTRESFISRLANLSVHHNKIDEDYFEELEDILIMADIGVNTVMNFIDRLKKRVKKENIESPEELKEIIVDELFVIYVNDDIISSKVAYQKDGMTVILFVGVNGTGKTTTIGKLANQLILEKKKVMMIAADTFRAGAMKKPKKKVVMLS